MLMQVCLSNSLFFFVRQCLFKKKTNFSDHTKKPREIFSRWFLRERAFQAVTLQKDEL